MAALRLGVGDVFTICKSALDLCAKATSTNHEDLKDIRMLVGEMEMMREHLHSIDTHISQRGVKPERDVSTLMSRSLGPIHTDIVHLYQTLQAQSHSHTAQDIHRHPSVPILPHALPHLHYHNQLAAFKKSLPRHRESISVMRDILESDCEIDKDQPNEGCQKDSTCLLRDHDGITCGTAKSLGNTAKRRSRRESIAQLASLLEREETLQASDCYDMKWIQASSASILSIPEGLSSTSPQSLTDILASSEPEDDPLLPENPASLDEEHDDNRPLSPRSSIFASAIIWNKPSFKLDIFEAFSCTNTPRSSPPPPSLEEVLSAP